MIYRNQSPKVKTQDIKWESPISYSLVVLMQDLILILTNIKNMLKIKPDANPNLDKGKLFSAILQR